MTAASQIESKMGMNRTGIGLSPILAGEMIEGATGDGTPSALSGEREYARVRQDYASLQETLGSMPPPSSVKGVAAVAAGLIQSKRPTVFLDRMGDRLAFERTGVRVYAALLHKFDALGGWEEGPTRADLVSIQQDELRHFELLREGLQALGADPTTMTPAADVSGVESMGVLQVVTDPRTTLPQALQAILTIELLDNDCWRTLIELAQELGHRDLMAAMQGALRDEDRHLGLVRGWLAKEALLAVRQELQAQTPESGPSGNKDLGAPA